MSWTVDVQGPSEYPYTKYKVSAYREGEAAERVKSSQFELDRKTIVGDFQRLLPHISGEIPRFRSLSKFADQDPLQSIFSIGARIYSALPEDLKNVIEDAKSIHIKTDDLEVPWEVMGEGEEPSRSACLKYSFGVSPSFIKRDRPPADLGETRNLRVLFIVNTKCNLPQTEEEIRSIKSIKCAKDIKVVFRTIEGKDAKWYSIRNYIKDNKLDIIHVAAHAEFNESNPGDSGIVVNDGLLTAKDVYKDVIKDPPWFVFMNACESARVIDSRYLEKYKELSGIADAFLVAGASSYIGTICKINDSAASQIATRFYDELLCNGSSVGQSMQNARKEFFDHHGDEDLSWLAFRLYGNPDLKRNLADEAIDAKVACVKEYIKKYKKKGFKGRPDIVEVATACDISVSEARRILSIPDVISELNSITK